MAKRMESDWLGVRRAALSAMIIASALVTALGCAGRVTNRSGSAPEPLAKQLPTGRLYRIPVNADGTAGAVVPIETSLPFTRPDGLRSAGPRTLIQAEGQGRVTELTIDGNRAEVRVVQDNLPGATGVTIVGDSALVLVSRLKAVVVPYRPR